MKTNHDSNSESNIDFNSIPNSDSELDTDVELSDVVIVLIGLAICLMYPLAFLLMLKGVP